MTQQYTIQPGDNLTAISKKYGVGISSLLQANQQIKDPNLIIAGQSLVIPSAGNNINTNPNPNPITPPVNPNENVDLSKSGRYVIDASNGTDQYDTQTGKKLTPQESQALGLNTVFLPKADTTQFKGGGIDTNGDGKIDVNTVLKDLGITLPTVDDGTEEGAIKARADAAKQKLDQFQNDLKKQTSNITNNPFLLSNEIMGEQKRLIEDNRDYLQTLIDDYNKEIGLLNDFRTQEQRKEDSVYRYTTLGLAEIERRAKAAQDILDRSDRTAADTRNFEMEIQQLRNATPAGQSFTVGGKVYQGTKTNEPTSTERAGSLKTQAIQAATPVILADRGADGFVSPDKYMSLRADYAAAIGDVSEFDDVFSIYLSPQNRQKYGVGKATGVDTTTDPLTAAKDYVTELKNGGMSKKDIEKYIDKAAEDADKILYKQAIKAVFNTP